MRDYRPKMSDLSWATNLKDPSVMAISPFIGTSFPLVREFGGVWVDRAHSQWVSHYTRAMLARGELSPEVREVMIRHHKDDLEWFLKSAEQNRPDVIIVNIGSSYSWLIQELKEIKPNFLEDYTTVSEEGIVRIMVRNVK